MIAGYLASQTRSRQNLTGFSIACQSMLRRLDQARIRAARLRNLKRYPANWRVTKIIAFVFYLCVYLGFESNVSAQFIDR
jgi:hypothetical protein